MSQSSKLATGCGHQHLTWYGALWSLPCTLVGIGFALLSGVLPLYDRGLLVAESRRGLAYLTLVRRGFTAITFGRVVIAVKPLTAELRQHEEHHVRQYGLLGVLFFPLYLFLTAINGYRANPFEEAARRCAERFVGREEKHGT